MNKGFILDGYPRNQEDAKAIFLEQEITSEGPYQGFVTNPKIIPQFVVNIDCDDAVLQQKLKDLPAEKKSANQNDP